MYLCAINEGPFSGEQDQVDGRGAWERTRPAQTPAVSQVRRALPTQGPCAIF